MTTNDAPNPSGNEPRPGEAPPEDDRSFFGQPKGLQTLFATEFWERYSFYGMRGFALAAIGLSFFVMSIAGRNATPTHKVSIIFLAVTYLLQTVGELCLSPVGLSVTTQLAPARYAGQILGLWFLATAVGNALNVYVTKLSTVLSDFSYFLSLGCVAVFIGVLVFLGARTINGLMGGVR